MPRKRPLGFLRWLIVVAVAAYVFVAVPWFLLRPSDLLSVAQLHTERIDIHVIDREKAAFQFNGFDVGKLGTKASLTCVSGAFTPGLDAVVSYGRIGKAPMEITITPGRGGGVAGVLQMPGAGPVEEFHEAVFMVHATRSEGEATCQAASDHAEPRMPVWGTIVAGREFRPARPTEEPEPSMMLDGSLKVSAHATYSDTLYQVAEMAIPVGGRMEAIAPDLLRDRVRRWIDVQLGGAGGAGSGPGMIWWGAAYVEDKPALTVSLATEAPAIAIYRPNRTTADTVRLTTLAQLTQDPTIVQATIILTVLSSLVGFLEWAVHHFHPRGDG